MNKDLTHLTPGERLWLWRRNQVSPSGRRLGRGGSWMTAQEAASCVGFAVKVWCAAELDTNSDAAEVALDAVNGHAITTTGDLCLIARRRAQTSLDELCAELAISRPTFHKLERAGHPDVVDVWLRRGFIFPEI